MNKEENLVNKLIDYFKGEVSGAIELLFYVSSFICLGYATVTQDIESNLLNNKQETSCHQEEANGEFEQLEQLKRLEQEVPILEGVFRDKNFKQVRSDSVKKAMDTIMKSDFGEENYKKSIEYLFQICSERMGKLAKEDTPYEVRKLMVDLLDVYEGSVYDPTSGFGGNLIEFVSRVENRENVEVFGQEPIFEICQLSKIRMYVNGYKNCKIECQNSLVEPYLSDKGDTIKKYDTVLMVYPFSLPWMPYEERIERDEYFRFSFGLPPRANADWLFISVAVSALKEKGRAVILTTLGSLFRGGLEQGIRQNLINQDYVESIIQLPANLFANTGIPVAIVVLNKSKIAKMKNRIQLINASEMCELAKKSRKILSNENINRVVDLYKNKEEVEELSKLISSSEIMEANLLPSKYVQSLVFDSVSFGKVRIHEDRIESATKLEDVGIFYRGINITSKYVKNTSGNYKIINYADVKDGELDIDSLQTYDIQNNAKVDSYRVKAGDIIISNKGVTKVCIIPKHQEKILISQNFTGIRLRDEYNARFVKEYLQSPLGEFLLERYKTGTSIRMISMKELKNVPFLYSDIKTQDKVMSEYESEEKKYKQQLLEIQEKLGALKKGLYEKMGIGDIVESI